MDERNVVAAVLAAGLAARNKPTGNIPFQPMQVDAMLSLYSQFLEAVKKMHPDTGKS